MTSVPSRAEVLRQLDNLRSGVRMTMTTIRKLEQGQQVDAEMILRRLASIRTEAIEVALAPMVGREPNAG